MANTWCYILLVVVTFIALVLSRFLFDEAKENRELMEQIKEMDAAWHDAMNGWKETLDISDAVNNTSADLQKAGRALLEEIMSKEEAASNEEDDLK